ncbi:MAG: lipid-A-disaccharide synthase [Elusimicrobiales bacterium]
MPDIIPTTKNILVVAGDPSGDLHGAALIRELKAKDPQLHVSCLGGQRMQQAADRFIYNLVGVGAGGFAEPLKRFFLWLRLINLARKFLNEKRPACVIAVDFYGFNHQLLGLAAHRKIPVFYYVCPQVWASRPKRAETIARLARHEFVIFPFEEKIYRDLGGKCDFIGHPLLDVVPQPKTPPENRGGVDYKWKIGLLPGSRPSEVARLMPVFWKAFLMIKEVFPNAEPYIFAAREISDRDLLARCEGGARPAIVREEDYAIRAGMDAALASSGTATLENAMLGLPMAVAYKMPAFTYAVARRVINVKYISLPNIIAGKQLVREYVQDAVSPEALSGQIMGLLQNPDRLNGLRAELLVLRGKLGSPGAARRAAETILAETFSQ